MRIDRRFPVKIGRRRRADKSHPFPVKGQYVKVQICVWAFLFILGMGSGLVAGEIYQWVDKDGVQHFTNEPPPPGAQIVNSTAAALPDDAPADTGADDADGDDGGNSSGDSVGDNGSDDEGVEDDVVVGEPRRVYPDEIRREADREAAREDYREEERPRPEAPRRLR
jgi:hypothetical protein